MLEAQKIKRLVVTLIKGLPIIILCLVAGLYIAKKSIQYSTPLYQSMAKIKLDDHKYGMSANNLYEDFDVFSTENKIETEAEILQSPLLITKAVKKMSLEAKFWRKGSMKNTFLYEDNPFLIELDSNFNYYDKNIEFTVNQNNAITYKNEESQAQIGSGLLNGSSKVEGSSFTLMLNETLLAQKELDVQGTYILRVLSEEGFVADIKKNLDVKAVDKEIAVLRVVYKNEDPVFAADFANTLCDVYVTDYIETKSMAAKKTLNFIDDRMIEINENLTASEDNLESYKMENDVVNTLQETETGLREISKLRIQLINLETEETATRELEEYISAGDYYEGTAINFGFGDLVLTELVKKLKLYTDEKKDLQLKYTDDDPRIVNVQLKIDDVEKYIKEAVSRNLQNIETKRREIEAALKILELQFEDIPTREKELHKLEREFMNNEAVYNFLFQKKLEAQIASSALISFHRVIQPASVSKEPVSPNRVLITFVCGFLSLIIGVIVVFGRKLISGKIIGKADIEKLTATPVLAAIKEEKGLGAQYVDLATTVLAKSKGEQHSILVTSSIKKEGKSHITNHLAQSYSKMGYKVAVLQFNPYSENQNVDYFIEDLLQEKEAIPTQEFVQIGFKELSEQGIFSLSHKRMDAVMNGIKQNYDIMLIDTAGAIISPTAQALLEYVEVALYVVRSKKSKVQYISNIDIMQEEANFDQMFIILNGVHASTNFSGAYNGSHLNYKTRPKGFKNWVKHYYQTYVKS